MNASSLGAVTSCGPDPTPAPPANGHGAGAPKSVTSAPAALGQRSNAVKHGCTATALVESLVGTDRVAALTAELSSTYAPVGVIEEQIVRQLARHMAALGLCAAAEDSALRAVINHTKAVQGILQASAAGGGGGCTCHSSNGSCPACQQLTDTTLMMAVASEPIGRIGKYAATHQRGVIIAFQLLEQLQSRRRQAAASSTAAEEPISSPPQQIYESIWLPATSEEECLERFLQWRDTQRIPCPKCGTLAAPQIISNRSALRCTKCRCQYGLRQGSPLADSKLPFLTWVRAIRLLAADPNTSVLDIATACGIGKSAARRVKKAIVQWLEDPAWQEELLAMAGMRFSRRKPSPPRKPR